MEGLQDALASRRRAVDAALAGAFAAIAPDSLREAARWYPDAGGKRLRPVMALLSCEAAGGSPEAALPVAVSVELVHNFSLVHDDIMDADDTRRGRPTVHTKWDDATAILAGDVLFARAFETLAAIPDPRAHREVSVLLSTAVRRLCEGQALDVAFETRGDVSVAEYVEMIRGKTAVLFEASCRAGALCAGAHRAADALGRFGEAFGLAFQVADDLLDVTADSATMGKPWGSDVRSGKQTVLVLEALATANARQRAAISAALGNPDATDAEVRAAVDAMRECGALARAEALRDRLAKEAAAALASLPPTPARRHLEELNEWARVRGF